MLGLVPEIIPSAGQRTSTWVDYPESQSSRPSRFVNHQSPPQSLNSLTHSVDDEDQQKDKVGEDALLDNSSEGGFDCSSLEELYDNAQKRFFYDSDKDWDIVGPVERPSKGDGEIAHHSTEDEDQNGHQNLCQSTDDEGIPSSESEDHGTSTTPVNILQELVYSPTSKLLATCLDADQPFLYDYLAQRKTLMVQFLQHNKDLVERFLTTDPSFVQRFLKRNQQQAWALFAEDPRWYLEQHLNKFPHLSQNYLKQHPEDVEIFINENPKYFDQYLVRHPEFAVNYLHFNRLPSSFGIPSDMFRVTSITVPSPHLTHMPPLMSAGLPSPESSPPPNPQPQPLADGVGSNSSAQRSPAAVQPREDPISRVQQSLPKAYPAQAGSMAKRQPPESAAAPPSSPLSFLHPAPSTPYLGQKSTAGPSLSKSPAVTATPATSKSSSHTHVGKALLNSSYAQTAGNLLSYPAPANLLVASHKQEAGPKGSWRLFEEDRVIKHMLDVRDEARLAGESRFEEVSIRLKAEGIARGFFAVKNYWNRTGRARSGFDERKNKTAPLATSKQGKVFGRRAKTTYKSKRRKGKGIKMDLDRENGDEEGGEAKDEDDHAQSVHSDKVDTRPLPPLPPLPPPPPPPLPAPGPSLQQTSAKRSADHNDEALAWAISRGTRPKKQRTG